MGFWFLDEKSQLALLMAGLVGSVGAAGCDTTPVPVDPAPRDARVENVDHGRVVDPAPPDLRAERPRDRRADQPQVVDPVPPPDLRVDRPQPVDPVPRDAAAWATPRPMPKPPTPPGARLPLERDLRAQIVARPLPGGALELQARPRGADPARLSYRWKVSGGTLDRTTSATVRWTPPDTPGPHLAQVTVRDGDRALAVEVFVHGLK